MTTDQKMCPRCGEIKDVISTNNKLVGDICISCISEALNFNDVNDLKLLSETLRIPFNPNKFYLAQMNADTEEEVLEAYFEYVNELDMENKDMNDGLVVPFKMINEEWQQIRTYHDLLLATPTFRKEFMSRNAVKWGYAFTFEQFVRLENIYTSTLKTYNISDPIRRDAVKKSAILSVQIDDMIFNNNAKDIKELTTAYQNFLKIADIDHVANTAANDGTIRTVADLVAYLESKGYHIQSDFVEKKDIVDLTLDNILENTRLIVSEKTGVDVDLMDIIEKAKEQTEDAISQEIYTRQALADDLYEEVERELEMELQNENMEFDMEDVSFLGE